MPSPRSNSEQRHHKQVQSDVDWMKGNLTSMGLRKFYGKVILYYENGVLKKMIEEKSHKPPTIS